MTIPSPNYIYRDDFSVRSAGINSVVNQTTYDEDFAGGPCPYIEVDNAPSNAVILLRHLNGNIVKRIPGNKPILGYFDRIVGTNGGDTTTAGLNVILHY